MPLIPFALGVIATLSLVVGLFFFRFYRETGDVLFAYFATAFTLEAVNRASLVLSANPNEGSPWLYLTRAVAYSLILVGVIHKNRR